MDAEKLNVGDIENDRNMLNKCDTHSKIGVESDKVEEPEQVNIDISCKTDNIVISQNNVPSNNENILLIHQSNVSITANNNNTGVSEMSAITDCDGSAHTKNIVITNIDKEEFMNSHGIEKDNINNNLCNTKPIENLISYNNDVIISCIDKDSDDESVTCDRIINRRIKNVIDSDEECNDNMNNKNHESVDTKATIYQRKKLNVIDSDSEEEEVLPSKEVPIYSVDIKGNLIQENNHSRLLAICDPDTDEDESTYIEERSFSENTSLETSKKSGKKRKPQIDSDIRTKKFTGRDAQKLKKEIQSESQRMTRESAIHLPYHKPKARTLTLKEFLQNRSCFPAAIPISNSKRPPSLAIKMSTDQLKAISEKLTEREKEVKKFFKSESESDEEENLEKSNISVQLTKNSVQEHLEDCHEKTGSASIIILQNIELVPCKDAGANNCPIDENNTPSCQPLQQLNKVETDNQVEIENSLINEIKVEEKSQNHNNNTKDQHVTINRENENYYTEEIETIKLINEDKGVNAVSEKHETDSSMQVENKEAVDTHEQTKDDKINETNLNLKLGFEKEETQNIENDNLNKLIEKYTSSEFTNETLDDVEKNKHTSEEKSQKSILDLVKDKFSNFKPQLQGSSDEIIDLEDGSIKVNEVNQLINRFVKHTKKISPTKHKVKLDIVSLSEGEIRKETVEMSVNGEETIPINEKPGERIKKLREELQMQMAQKRSEVWQQRSDTKIRDKTMSTEVEGTDYKEEETDILDDDNEEVFTNTEDEEDEDMDEEDEDMDEDVETKPKNIFLDEEADESDIDDDEMDPEETENNENVFEKSYHLGGESETEEYQQSISNFEKHRKKKLKRIIQPFSNESDDESTLDVHEDFKSKQEHLNLNDPEKVKEIQLDSTDTWDENCELTPHQARKSQTPLRRQTQSKSELGFLTPVVQLTGLQSLNSGSKFLHESPISPFVAPSDTSPIKPSSQSGPQKKLFADMDLTTTQDLKEVAELCSGVFPSQSQEFDSSSVKDDNTRNVSEDFNSVSAQIGVTQNLQTPSTQDLLEICSGQFTGITQIAVPRKDKQDIQTTGISEFNNNSKSSQSLTEVLIQNNEIKNLDGEDNLISEILNEEEMENFKRKFDSPVSNSPTSVSFSRIIYDSSDEETNLPIKMKNKQRKLVFSDEEDTDEDELVNECDENIELHDEYSKDDDSNVDEVKNVDYDSEENEIEWVEEDKPKKMKIADFLENEAELSESEWGSADEDERDLDELELEEGDNEKFDEQQVKRDLERIHIRRVLDDDNHEIKILQEILLDDGEMHGNGRERQFRWKNIDSIDSATDIRQDNGEVYLDEDEDEEKWRKMRYEREVFLKKQLQKSQSLDIEDDLHVKASSQIIKLGQAAIKRSISTSQNVSVVSERQIAPAKLENSSGILLNKRGSFLTRSDQVLERVAEFTKTLTSVSNTKNSKNFIFQAVSASTKTIIPNKKRKAMTDSPTAIKRLRLNNLSPLVQKIGRKGE